MVTKLKSLSQTLLIIPKLDLGLLGKYRNLSISLLYWLISLSLILDFSLSFFLNSSPCRYFSRLCRYLFLLDVRVLESSSVFLMVPLLLHYNILGYILYSGVSILESMLFYHHTKCQKLNFSYETLILNSLVYKVWNE